MFDCKERQNHEDQQINQTDSNNIKVYRGITYEAKLYIGSREHYDGPAFDTWHVEEAIKEFQTKTESFTLRISSTRYIYQQYAEYGYEVAATYYLRFPKSQEQIKMWMINLAKFLLLRLKQNRVSLVCTDETIMVEHPHAIDNPKT